MSRIKPGKNISKRDLITQKAASLFKKKGYQSSSMRELAEMIGVEAPSLYNHIGGKSELLQSICFKVADAFTAHLESTETITGTAPHRLETIVRFHIRMMLNNFNEVYVANHEWKNLAEPYLGIFLNQRRTYEKKIIDLVQLGIQNQQLRNRNPYVAVLTILSALRGLEFWQQHKKNIDNQVLENDMVAHLLEGIIK